MYTPTLLFTRFYVYAPVYQRDYYVVIVEGAILAREAELLRAPKMSRRRVNGKSGIYNGSFHEYNLVGGTR